MPEQDHDGLTIAWCRDPDLAPVVAHFFVEEADPAYISHSELQSGRAAGPMVWAEDLKERIRITAQDATKDGSGSRLVLLQERGALAGFALVTFVADAPRPYAVLEDLLIASATRGRGLGDRLLAWLEAECRVRGITRMFLESGQSNGSAHRFFARHGFDQTSIVMMREF